MCLLVVAFGVVPGAPLLIGANRDEFLNRPAIAMTVLRAKAPRVVGGRDEQSGGTWLAVNERGRFAGLTNEPLGDARDPSRRTRGELPLALTSTDQVDVAGAVNQFLDRFRPRDYNGSWLLTGDRDALYFIDFTGGGDARAEKLPPGLYVLGNRPLGAPSPKADHVVSSLAEARSDADTTIAALRRVLVDHTVTEPGAPGDMPNASATCVHLDEYGTRSSCIIRCDEDPATRPQVWVADGPPCTAPFVDVSGLWRSGSHSPR
jgi:uncharacterized protein with NRDE domain